MKFNYIYYIDPKTKKTFVVTIAYDSTGYAFAIQSLKDQHSKKEGRALAEGRFITGYNIAFSREMTWNDIKNHFDAIRQSNRRWYFTLSSISCEFTFPTHTDKAIRLPSKKEYLSSINI